MHFLDRFGAPVGTTLIQRVAGQAATFGLFFFAIAIPHSIAGAHIGLNLALLGWIVRDVAARKLHFTLTPIDWPLLSFVTLTLLSAVFSVEPQLSLPKLMSLLLFGVVYLCAANLSRSGVRVFLGLLIISALAGVFFSLGEKAVGRGMTVTLIAANSPLAGSGLRPDDVIWMIDRHRVSSMDEAATIIRRVPAGRRIEIEALHNGDPLPAVLTVTDEIKAQANPLGLLAEGRTRRFRISGFTRHFITYADQMQLLGLFSFGGLIVAYRQKRRFWLWFALTVLFAVALILTAARAAIVAYLLALIITAGLASSRRLLLGAMAGAVIVGVIALSVLVVTRQSAMARFDDPSSLRRLGFMRAGLRIIPAHPLLGVGMDSHKHHWGEWGFPGEYITHTHSTPIQLAMDRGLPALGCYIWLMWVAIIFAWREFRLRKDAFPATLAMGTLAALIGFNVGSLVNYNFGDAEVLLLLLALLGLVVATKNKGQENNDTLLASNL